ncbi:sugar phosphate isomerase/epimerase [bacterium]|nr:sugar phosphate isomerase/epimerase [bacterium]
MTTAERKDHQDIRIGTLVNRGQDSPRYISEIQAYGFESFSLAFGRNVGSINLGELAEDLKTTLEGTNGIISTVSVYGNPLEEDEGAQKTRESWEALIDNAHLFDCDLVTGFTGRLRGKPIPDSISRYKEVFSPLADRAGEKGVRLAFENCDMGGDLKQGDWNIAHTPNAWELMFEATPHENIGLEWEPCHQMVKLIDPIHQLRQWLKRIFHVHGKCATIRWDLIHHHGICGPQQFAWHRTPGFGDLDWTDVISELRMAGFRGCIDIEGWHDPVYRDDLEMTGQVYSLHYLQRCRGGVYVKNPK